LVGVVAAAALAPSSMLLLSGSVRHIKLGWVWKASAVGRVGA
jgi:hypothetical protein